MKGATTACEPALAYKPLAQTQPCAGHLQAKPQIPHIAVTEVLGPHKAKWEEIKAVTKFGEVRSPHKRLQEGSSHDVSWEGRDSITPEANTLLAIN